MTNPTDRDEPFKREERFIVVKRKRLREGDEDALRKLLEVRNITTVECVVVESDWPEYETVWAMIEARCTGRPTPQAGDALTASGNDVLRELLVEIRDKGLIYWEPLTERGRHAKNDMLDRIDAALSTTPTKEKPA